MVYRVALFIHITGVLIYFVGVGLEVTALRGLRRARTAGQVLNWLQLGHGILKLFRLSLVLIFLAGLYMTLIAWAVGTPWIDVALAVLIVFNVLGPLVNGRRFKAIGQAVGAFATDHSDHATLPAELECQLLDPVLRASIHIMAAVSLGIVCLMTLKPDLIGSIATLAVAAAVGWLSTLTRREGARDAAAASGTVPA